VLGCQARGGASADVPPLALLPRRSVGVRLMIALFVNREKERGSGGEEGIAGLGGRWRWSENASKCSAGCGRPGNVRCQNIDKMLMLCQLRQHRARREGLHDRFSHPASGVGGNMMATWAFRSELVGREQLLWLQATGTAALRAQSQRPDGQRLNLYGIHNRRNMLEDIKIHTYSHRPLVGTLTINNFITLVMIISWCAVVCWSCRSEPKQNI
jgi:hypothetical protein